jgi:predicted metal-binding membrane protein
MRSRASSVSWPDATAAGAIAMLALLAWWTLWLESSSPYGHALLHGAAHLRSVSTNPWFLAALFVVAWTLMTMAMMLPTTIPLIVLFHRMIQDRSTAVWLIALLVFGYLAVWTVSGLLLQLVYWSCGSAVARMLGNDASPSVMGALLLAGAGAYQFSPLKQACLDQCRSPMSFLRSRWQGGNESMQALRIGVEHGAFCVGCCWSLMLLMFAVGAASLSWMLMLGVVMAAEKNLPGARRLRVPIGALLLAGAAAWFVAGARSSASATTPEPANWCHFDRV